jgi:hypothetical protein
VKAVKRVMVALALAQAAHVWAQCPAPRASGARLLPSYFDQGRVLAAPVSRRGDTVYFILDSGGGFNAFMDNRVAALALTPRITGTGKDTATVVTLASFVDSIALPAPTAGYPHDGTLVVSKDVDGLAAFYGVPPSGFLGGGWWADKVWQIDYRGHELWLYPRSVLRAGAANPHQIPLGFRTSGSGARTTNFPRFRALIDGDSLDLLFDTGATTRFTDSALTVLGDHGPPGRAGSFITAEVFDRWRARHPDWRVVEGGERDTRQALIEVPSMQIAGYTVGPVVWERRATADFHKLMDPLMDQPVKGSLGGAGFQFFSITMDYRASLACFQK